MKRSRRETSVEVEEEDYLPLPLPKRVLAEKKIVKENTPKVVATFEEVGVVTYNRSFLRIMYQMCLLGATEVQICEAIGITVYIFSKWKKQYPEVNEILLEGKALADANVADSIYQAALGFEHEEEVILSNRVTEYDDFGKPIRSYTEPLRVKTIKKYPPNVKAGTFWLNARRPDIWNSGKVQLNANIVQINGTSLEEFSDKELSLLKKLGVGTETKENKFTEFEEL